MNATEYRRRYLEAAAAFQGRLCSEPIDNPFWAWVNRLWFTPEHLATAMRDYGVTVETLAKFMQVSRRRVREYLRRGVGRLVALDVIDAILECRRAAP